MPISVKELRDRISRKRAGRKIVGAIQRYLEREGIDTFPRIHTDQEQVVILIDLRAPGGVAFLGILQQAHRMRDCLILDPTQRKAWAKTLGDMRASIDLMDKCSEKVREALEDVESFEERD